MARLSSHFDLQDARFSSLVFESYPIQTVTSQPADPTVTLTPAQLLSGWIFRSIGAARTDNMPTAAALVEAIQGVMVNQGFNFRIRNISSGAFAHTLSVTGVTGASAPTTGAAQSLTTNQNSDHSYRVVFTNVTPGQEAYNLYSMSPAGGGTF